MAGGPKNTYPTPPGMDAEMQNIYHDLKYPNIQYAIISSETVTTSSITALTLGGNANANSFKITRLANGTAATDAAAFGQITTITGGQLPATATNDNATVGNLGEYISSTTALNSYTLTSGAFSSVAAVTLTAGDWDLFPMGCVDQISGANVFTRVNYCVTTTQNGGAGCVFMTNQWDAPAPITAGNPMCSEGMMVRESISSTTTFYLNDFATWSTGSVGGNGTLLARRAR